MELNTRIIYGNGKKHRDDPSTLAATGGLERLQGPPPIRGSPSGINSYRTAAEAWLHGAVTLHKPAGLHSPPWVGWPVMLYRARKEHQRIGGRRALAPHHPPPPPFLPSRGSDEPFEVQNYTNFPDAAADNLPLSKVREEETTNRKDCRNDEIRCLFCFFALC